MESTQDDQPSLPPELTDEIIGWVGASTNPRSHLSSCSLVCKSWLPASRSHLFHSTLITPTKATRWIPLLRSPHLTPHLRRVEIREQRGRGPAARTANVQMDSLYDLLAQIAPLSSVTSLSVDVPSWFRVRFGRLFTAFRNITHLTLRNMLMRDNLQLIQILSHFALLTEISLWRVQLKAFVPTPQSAPLSAHLSPHLHTLKIIHPTAVLGSQDWIYAAFPLMSVPHLELRGLPAHELAAAASLVRHLHEHLQSLFLSLDPSVDFTSLPAHFQPRYNTNLRIVHLILDFELLSLVHPIDNHRFCWVWMCRFLADLPPGVETLVVELTGEYDAIFDVDWGMLAQALGGPQFSTLRAFQLETPPHNVNTGDVEAYVTGLLPSALTSRGIVRVKSQLEMEPEEDLDGFLPFVGHLAS
ncbi:hypothetical protein C8R44DRAFT_894115 [Mycena epipterygia]|nr:hypothetical protein C8R44DRAFT_894115 [Mycena epipterygia]